MPLASQTAPLWQVVPQQGFPGTPQAEQTAFAQVNPVLHAEPVQQSCVSPPQATHFPLLPHRLPAAQVEPPQHNWPKPPQSPQIPTDKQVTPAPQVCPLQHNAPTVPHETQTPVAQTASPMQLFPGQQGPPMAPQEPPSGGPPVSVTRPSLVLGASGKS